MKWTVRLVCLVMAALLMSGMALADVENGLTISGVNEFPLVEEPLTFKIWTTSREHIVDPETNAMAVLYEEKTNVHLEMTLSKDKNTELNLMLASRDYPDMFLTTFSTDQVTMFMEGGVLAPLNELIEEYGFYTKQVLEANPNFVNYLTTPDGNIYTLFETDVGVHMPYRHKLHVYKPWLEALGIEKPVTTDEFRTMLELFRDSDLNGNGIADEIPLISDNTGEGDPIAYLMSPFQLMSDEFFHITDDGEIIFEANTDEWRDGLRWIKSLSDDGLFLAEETYVQDREQLKALVNKAPEDFLVGSITHFFQGRYVDKNVVDWTDYTPVGPLEGPTGLRQAAAADVSFTFCSAISSTCANPKVAMKWLDWWLSEEGTFANTWGLREGVDYAVVDLPSFSGEATSISSLMNSYDGNYRYGENFLPKNDSYEVRYAATDDPSNYFTNNTFILVEAGQLYMDYEVPHNIPTIVWCSDMDLVVQINEFKLMFKDYIKQAYTEFILGVRDLDTQWEDYKSELEAMGLETYLDLLAKYYAK